MTAKLDYRWHLRQVMATRGMFATTDLIDVGIYHVLTAAALVLIPVTRGRLRWGYIAGMAALLIVGQLVLGQLILSGRGDLIKAHQHSGYTAVVVALIYIVLSLVWIASSPTRPKS